MFKSVVRILAQSVVLLLLQQDEKCFFCNEDPLSLVVWCGVVWCGVVWCGVVWCGVVWCGVVWCGVGRNLNSVLINRL